MRAEEYNYAVFDMQREGPKIDAFPDFPLRPGGRAPDFPLEDLETGGVIRMRELWREGLMVVEFGSFT